MCLLGVDLQVLLDFAEARFPSSADHVDPLWCLQGPNLATCSVLFLHPPFFSHRNNHIAVAASPTSFRQGGRHGEI